MDSSVQALISKTARASEYFFHVFHVLFEHGGSHSVSDSTLLGTAGHHIFTMDAAAASQIEGSS